MCGIFMNHLPFVIKLFENRGTTFAARNGIAGGIQPLTFKQGCTGGCIPA